MAKEEQKAFVEHITPRDENYSQWYTDVVTQADLMDYTPVRGCMALKPYGYRIWELIQEDLDRRFKETGHENVAMPMLIPESLLQKEADHVEGFAPEVAWVTHGGNEKLQERLAVRPTSEVIFCTMFAKWVQSWRDLPLKYNQWCSVMRWEKSTRPFLRTSEFWWQEGHTIHATEQEAHEEALQMLEVYREFCEETLSIPVFSGRKTEKETFAGARTTYSVEAMMQDGKALQAGTSHDFGTNFSEPFEIQFLDKDGQLKYCYETSWGVSTRLIGAIIMTHGDERGLRLPPKVAPYQAVIVPIAAHKEGVLEKAEEIYVSLKKAGVRVRIDDRDYVSPGWKFNEWELKGVPLRIEIGPRDIKNGVAMCARRDTNEKFTIKLDGIVESVKESLNDIQDNLYKIADEFKVSRTKDVFNMQELEEQVNVGYARAMWCGSRECEDLIKDKTSATTRNIPFDAEAIGDKCVCCGKDADTVIYFAKAY